MASCVLSIVYGGKKKKLFLYATTGSKSVRELQRIYLKEKRDVFEKENGGGLLSWITTKCNTKKLQEVLQEWLGKDVALNEKKPPDHPRYNTMVWD